MTPWITIAEDDLKQDGKAAQLVDSFINDARGSGEDQSLDSKIAGVINRIRGEIRSGGKIRVSLTPNTIPPSLRELAIRMVLWSCQSRINILNSLPPTDQDNRDHASDERYLERIAKGEVTVEEPTDPAPSDEVQVASQSPTISSDRLEIKRNRVTGFGGARCFALAVVCAVLSASATTPPGPLRTADATASGVAR